MVLGKLPMKQCLPPVPVNASGIPTFHMLKNYSPLPTPFQVYIHGSAKVTKKETQTKDAP